MTEEQIRQNAENYVDSLRDPRDIGKFYNRDMVKAYIAGAHSRDEEIKKLKEELESLNEHISQIGRMINRYI